MPSARCKAAFDYLTTVRTVYDTDKKGNVTESKLYNNKFYCQLLHEQKTRIANGSSLNLSSYDLFIVWNGIECGMFPALYPNGEWSDTGFQNVYVESSGDAPPAISR